MSTESQVHDAQSIQEALLAVARALDRIEQNLDLPRGTDDDWNRWQPMSDPAPTEDGHYITAPVTVAPPGVSEVRQQVVTSIGEDKTEIKLPKVSAKRQGERYAFAIDVLKIDQYAKAENTWDDRPANYDSWAHVYAQGGPAWLYNANRDFVMSLPYETRAELVADLIQDDPQAAHEMSRDILKKDAETSPGNGVGPSPDF